MKLILTAEVEHLGSPGDTVEVKDGYGRNYLLPRGLAMLATAGRVKELEHQHRVVEDEDAPRLDVGLDRALQPLRVLSEHEVQRLALTARNDSRATGVGVEVGQHPHGGTADGLEVGTRHRDQGVVGMDRLDVDLPGLHVHRRDGRQQDVLPQQCFD